MTDNISAPAGWYPAPHANGEQRYWDGARWTDWTPESAAAAHREAAVVGTTPDLYRAQTATATAESQPPQQSRAGLRWWAWLLIAFGVLIVVGVVIGAINGGRAADRESEARPTSAASQETEVESAEQDTRVDTPDVVGSTIGQARAALEGVGLVVKTVGEPGDDWIVTSQTITVPAEPGTEVMLLAEAPKPKLTMGQEQASRKAQSYLDLTGFSRTGLIEQLEFEGFSIEDATFAVDYLAPDWNAEAAEKAQSYIDMTSFSQQGLIEQLMFEGFDQAQAEYGVAAVGY